MDILKRAGPFRLMGISDKSRQSYSKGGDVSAGRLYNDEVTRFVSNRYDYVPDTAGIAFSLFPIKRKMVL